MSAPDLKHLRPAQWQAAVAVLRAVVLERRVADASLQHWFREHRAMGSRDRALVAALVYGVLRDFFRLRHAAGSDTVETLLGLWLLSQGLERERLSRFDPQAVAALGEHALAALAAVPPAAAANVPEALWAMLCEQYGEPEARALASALNGEASVDLRVNLLRANVPQVQAALQAAGLVAHRGRWSPTALRLERRASLQTLACFRDGWIEPQDEGSQLLAMQLDVRPGERVADFCAGAGGKTLALAAAMQGRGELWALDIDAARLARLGPRAARAGVEGLRVRTLPDPQWLQSQAGGFDAVLVDAPCSGSGTWRRAPDLRLRTADIAELALLQGRILADAARLLRPGGRLVYATCSVLAAENEAVVAGFLSSNSDFFAENDVIPSELADPQAPGVLRLLPHRHGTDGYFAARLRRR